MAPATARLKAFPAPTVAMAAKRSKGPPLLVSEANPHVTAIAPQANGSRPASLAHAGERSVAVQSARVSTAMAKAVISETMLRVRPNGWVNADADDGEGNGCGCPVQLAQHPPSILHRHSPLPLASRMIAIRGSFVHELLPFPSRRVQTASQINGREADSEGASTRWVGPAGMRLPPLLIPVT